LLLGLASPLLVNCGLLGSIPGAGCPALKDGNFADLKISGGAEVEGQLKGFLEGVYKYDQLVIKMETDLIAACAELGKAAGMDDAALAAEANGGEGAKKVCGDVAAKVDGIIKAAADATITVEIGEPTCFVDVNGALDCLKGCSASLDAGQLEAACDGDISCSIEAGGECNGSCAGNCEGTCDGNESTGSCAGTCEGKCDASCRVKAEGGCSGSAQCSGSFTPPTADIGCFAQCGGAIAGSVSCDPPTIDVKVEGSADSLKDLVVGIKGAIPKIINIGKGTAKAAISAGESMATQVAALGDVASKGGLQAIGCIAQAGGAVASATAGLTLNVEASVTISGSVTGSGGGEG
jgi:hypothetical protein